MRTKMKKKRVCAKAKKKDVQSKRNDEQSELAIGHGQERALSLLLVKKGGTNEKTKHKKKMKMNPIGKRAQDSRSVFFLPV